MAAKWLQSILLLSALVAAQSIDQSPAIAPEVAAQVVLDPPASHTPAPSCPKDVTCGINVPTHIRTTTITKGRPQIVTDKKTVTITKPTEVVRTVQVVVASPNPIAKEGGCFVEKIKTRAVIPRVTITQTVENVEYDVTTKFSTSTKVSYYDVTETLACTRKVPSRSIRAAGSSSDEGDDGDIDLTDIFADPAEPRPADQPIADGTSSQPEVVGGESPETGTADPSDGEDGDNDDDFVHRNLNFEPVKHDEL